MKIIQRWKRHLDELMFDEGPLDINPMVEPQVRVATQCIVAALFTIAEVIQERD
tara:strand:- start:3 stop:164 length:162 start_codon:yes stop_codon:yes gene_type:complete